MVRFSTLNFIGTRHMASEEEPGRAARRAILIVDDHPLVRRGLAALIACEPDLTVCAEASTCAAALEAVGTHAPDPVIVELALDGRGGLDLLKDLKERYPAVPA